MTQHVCVTPSEVRDDDFLTIIDAYGATRALKTIKTMAEAMLKTDSKNASNSTADGELDTSNRQDGVVTFNLSKSHYDKSYPSKRKKIMSSIAPTTLTAREIVRDIFHSLTNEDRMGALSAASTCFDHDLSEVHDEEVDAAADVALCKTLALLLMKYHFSQDTDYKSTTICELWKEFGLTCRTIEMIYRCSDTNLSESFHKRGSELLPLLLTVIAHCLQRSNEESRLLQTEVSVSDSSSDIAYYCSMTIKASCLVIARFASVPTALVPLAQHRGLLSTLKRVSISPVVDDARFSALWTISNLAYNAENMVMIACHPGLVDALVDIALDDSSFEARNHAMKAISNLAWMPENKIPLSERPRLLDSTVALIGSTVNKTRRHAAKALRFLSDTTAQEKVRLCQHGDSIILSTLLKRASSDADRSVRECAATAISNIVCAETAELMGSFPGLLQTLSKIAVMTERGNAPTIAGEALCSLCEHITQDMQCYQDLSSCVCSVLSSNEEDQAGNNFSTRRQSMLLKLGHLQKKNFGDIGES